MNPFDGPAPDRLRDGALERLRRLVELESPSGDEARLRAVAAAIAAELADLGAGVETDDVPGVGAHVVATLAGQDPDLPAIVLLGHLDTVHPVGSFDPVFRVRDGRAEGPGAFDMKGGWACIFEALAVLHAAGALPRRPVRVLATCDEETGSRTSRGLIERVAAGAHAVLVLEPPMPDGGAKTRRKGTAGYRISAVGRASHAGLAPEAGINAVVDLAQQILTLTGLAAPDVGTTVTVTTVRGGTASNVVPAAACADVDVRFTTAAEAARIDAAVRALAPRLAGARLEVEGGIDRPPMERTAASAALYEQARAVAAGDGWDLGEGLAGGASDGSLTSARGIPTLDGLGPAGGGAHAADEHIRVDDLARRVRLLGRLLEVL